MKLHHWATTDPALTETTLNPEAVQHLSHNFLRLWVVTVWEI